MSVFWTPYEPEQNVLDLSMPAAVKSELLTPPPADFPHYYHSQNLAMQSPSPPRALQNVECVLATPPASPSDERVSSGTVWQNRAEAAVTGWRVAAAPDHSYEAFRHSMLEARRAENGGFLTKPTRPWTRRLPRRPDEAPETPQSIRRREMARTRRHLVKLREYEQEIRVQFLERRHVALLALVAQLSVPRVCPYCMNSFPVVQLHH